MAKWYNLSVNGDVADVMFYNEIGAMGITAEAFVNEIKGITAKTINLHINSYGGEVFAALAIYNALKAHPARVVSMVEGIAASAATIVMLAGDEVQMASNAFLMIHNSHIGVYGDSKRLQKEAETGTKVDQQMAELYAAKMGLKVEEVQPLMDAETWYTADEALAAKLVDTVVGEVEYAHAAKLVIEKHPKAPEGLKKVAAATPSRSAEVDLAKQQLAQKQAAEITLARTRFEW